jgi:hypothetical protein
MRTDAAFAAVLRQVECLPECARLKFPGVCVWVCVCVCI